MSAPLLVIDGDSFAHRAFHAMPRSIRRANGRPANLLTGLTSMVLRLWQAERPRAVFVGWDTLTVPTTRYPVTSRGGRGHTLPRRGALAAVLPAEARPVPADEPVGE